MQNDFINSFCEIILLRVEVSELRVVVVPYGVLFLASLRARSSEQIECRVAHGMAWIRHVPFRCMV